MIIFEGKKYNFELIKDVDGDLFIWRYSKENFINKIGGLKLKEAAKGNILDFVFEDYKKALSYFEKYLSLL